MACKLEGSCCSASSTLDLFSVPPTTTDIKHGHWVEYTHLNPLTDEGPIIFDIPSDKNDYISLKDSYMHVRAKIVNADGSDIANDAEVAPCNNLLQSIFKQVDVSLNNQTVTSSTNTYHLRAYIENLLSYGTEAKSSQLTAGLWYKDTAGELETIGDGNNGYAKRKALAAGSRTIDLLGRIHSDMFSQPRHLLQGIDMKLKFVRNPADLVLMAAQNSTFKLKILSFNLFIRKVKAMETTQFCHIQALSKTPAKYPLRRVEVTHYSLPAGTMIDEQNTLLNGQIPNRVVIGCIDSAAMTGQFNKNPYNFKNYNIKQCALNIEGEQIPLKPLQPDFTNHKFIRSYFSLFDGQGKHFEDQGCDISREEYPKGFTLFSFDLTGNLEASDNILQLIKTGNVRLSLQFRDPLPNAINVICYAEYQSVLEIDKAGNVRYDYQT